MKIFVTDTETTGLDPKGCQLIEVAGCIYETTTQTILESYQSLLHGTENACESINHISPLAMALMPEDQMIDVKEITQMMANSCDFLIAHNAEFDRGFFEANGFVLEKPWVCSKKDLTFPGSHKSMRLGHLCYDFDIPVLKAHSALHDVYILIELLKKIPNLEDQLKWSQEPKTAYEAVVSYDNKDLAKSKGFSWDRSKKKWLKDLRESELEELKKEGTLKLRKAE